MARHPFIQAALFGVALLGSAHAAAQDITALWYQAGSASPVAIQPPSAFQVAQANANIIAIRADAGGPSDRTVEFQAPTGRTLQAGVAYEMTPGTVRMSGYPCGFGGTRFAVRELVYQGEALASFAADFECADGGGYPRVFGEMRYHSSVPLTIQRGPVWTSPGPMAFKTRPWVLPGATAISDETTVYGVTFSTAISISGGEYSINGAPFTSQPGAVVNRDHVRVRATAPGDMNAQSVATLQVGDVSVPFVVQSPTTGVPVSVAMIEETGSATPKSLTLASPEIAFVPNFGPVDTAAIQIGSNFTTGVYLIGFSMPTDQPVVPGVYEPTTDSSVYWQKKPRLGLTAYPAGFCPSTGGRFVIHEVAFADGRLTQLAADFEKACVAGGSIYGEIRFNSSVPFTFQKPAGTTTPSGFRFEDSALVLPGTTVESNTVSVFGTNAPSAISVAGGEYSINGGPYTSAPGSVAPRDHVRVRGVAASGPTQTVQLTIGGVSASFLIRSYQAGQALTAFEIPGRVVGFAPEWTLVPAATFAEGVRVTIMGDGNDDSLWVMPPPGQTLQVGAYENAARAPFNGASPGIDFSENFSGCNRAAGRFTILEIEKNAEGMVTKLAVDFERRCEITQPPVYGELRYNSTIPLTRFKPANSALPDPMAFSAANPVRAGTWVQSNRSGIYGVNAAVPLSITNGEYSLNGGSFTSQPGFASNRDEVVVRTLSSAIPGQARVATLQAGGRAIPFSVRTYQPGEPLTLLGFRSPPGDYIGQGSTSLFLAPPNLFDQANVGPTDTILPGFDVEGGAWWDLYLSSGTARSLVPGTYENAVRAPFNGAAPGLSFGGDGRGCNQVAGRFVLHDIALDSAGKILRLAADFEQRCENVGPPLIGEIRVNSTVASSFFAPDAAAPPLAHGFDTNADGRADIAWQHADGRQALWQVVGPTAQSAATLVGAGTGWSIVAFGDFDADDKSDLVWQHTDGRVAIWLMNGTALKAAATLIPAASGWKPKHIADFNGDRRSDILWEHTDGRVAMWLMNGTSLTAAATLIDAGTGWSARHVGDFDGNGKADILWEHTDGRPSIWLMDGTRLTDGGVLFAGGTGWSAKLVADVTNDGKADIVWVHTDGRVSLWTMNGRALAGATALQSAGNALVPVLAADVDGDGKADILWRDGAGLTTCTFMNGAAVLSSATLFAAGSGWTPVRSVDFSGERRSDVLSMHTDGRARMDFFEAGAFNGALLLGAGTGWTPISLRD